MRELPQTKPLRLVAQEHALGCGVACVASRLDLAYAEALKLFRDPRNAWTVGYFCSEIVDALSRGDCEYTFAEFDPSEHSALLSKPGSIVFVEAGPDYPVGHYLIRASREGWMNSWANSPQLIPIEPRFVPELPGRVSHVIFEVGIPPDCLTEIRSI